ncbi:S-layer family protein [Bacillus oleivorans]|uniref:S-layer family protein n=1 Tax=Bacillus oleivorans TaxID=1448271 RepID=A0A285CIK6_9BACI|nr:S-layer homology domain-containing protein [Bacillus oleivorans]SNX67349.1 S-layer family protein [Bacillus oleivorans]
MNLSKKIRNLLTIFATVLLVFTTLKSAEASFTDVNKNYTEAVDYLISQNATSGISETQFGTDLTIKRIDAAVMIAKVVGLTIGQAPNAGFTDVPQERQAYVNALVEAGIFHGKTSTRFGTYDTMTREEMAKVIASAYDLVASEGAVLPFTDVSDRFYPYVAALYENGVASGKDADTFGTGNVTRGEFALFIYRAANGTEPEVIGVY